MPLREVIKQGFSMRTSWFDGYCQIRLEVLKAFMDAQMKPFSNGGYVNVRPFNDTVATVQSYLDKHQNALTSNINTTAQPPQSARDPILSLNDIVP